MKSLVLICTMLIVGIRTNPCYKIDIELHFVNQPKLNYNNLEPIAQSIINSTQILLQRPALSKYNIQLHLVDVKLVDDIESSHSSLESYCNQQAGLKSNKTFIALLLGDVNNGYIGHKLWQEELFANSKSMCDNTKNCALMHWDTISSAALMISRSLAISLGAPLDSEGNNCTDDTIMLPELYFIDHSTKWSECTLEGVSNFLKSNEARCIQNLDETKKLDVYVHIYYDKPENAYYLKCDDVKNEFKREVEGYFNNKELYLQIDLHITFSENNITFSDTNNITLGPCYLKHYCNIVKNKYMSTDDTKYLTVFFTANDIYEFMPNGSRNYDIVFYSGEGNYCDESSNCAVIEHGFFEDNAFNMVRVIARSLGISLDASKHSNCHQDETIMSVTNHRLDCLPQIWSICSKNDFEAFMATNASKCLGEHKTSQNMTRNSSQNKKLKVDEKYVENENDKDTTDIYNINLKAEVVIHKHNH